MERFKLKEFFLRSYKQIFAIWRLHSINSHCGGRYHIETSPLYENGVRHERVKANIPVIEKSVNWLLMQLVSNLQVSIILKLMKNAFYFTLNALFVLLKIFRFFATTWNKLHIVNFAWDGDICGSNHLKRFIKFHKIHGKTPVPESLF